MAAARRFHPYFYKASCLDQVRRRNKRHFSKDKKMRIDANLAPALLCLGLTSFAYPFSAMAQDMQSELNRPPVQELPEAPRPQIAYIAESTPEPQSSFVVDRGATMQTARSEERRGGEEGRERW